MRRLSHNFRSAAYAPSPTYLRHESRFKAILATSSAFQTRLPCATFSACSMAWNEKGGVPPGPIGPVGINDKILLTAEPAAKCKAFVRMDLALKPILLTARTA